MSGATPWDRPWSMNEIIENSQNWNLAGDVALLNTLKSFAENLIYNTNEINNNLNKLNNDLHKTSLKLNIAQNEFQSLRNRQFIESRVYEDDESLVAEQKQDDLVVEGKEDHSDDIRLAALKGLNILDEFFEKVQVSVSDSEEDEQDNLPNYLLRPKDQYIDRPLPYVIGTNEWHQKWHVGLEDSSSDSETEKVSEKFSESDSDDHQISQNQNSIKATSESNSELDFEKKSKILTSSSESITPPPGERRFAEELTKKLGNVICEPEVNKRPIQSVKSNFGDIFFDEPPPLEEEPRGPFATAGGLFDDDEDDEIEKGGLFDSDEESPPKKLPLFHEEPPEIIEEKKIPIGGISVFGDAHLFEEKKVDLFEEDAPPVDEVDEKSVKKINLFDSDEEEFPVTNKKVEVKEANDKEKTVKKVSLFDDDDDPFQDDLFSSTTTKKFTSGLFDDIHDDNLFEVKDSLFEDDKASKTPPKENSLKTVLLEEEPSKIEEPSTIGLFDNEPSKNTLFEDDLSKTDLFHEEPPEDDFFTEISDKNSINTDSSFVESSSLFPPQLKFVSLFDPTPPEDDHWEQEKEIDIDFKPTTAKTDIFSEEPPSLQPEKKPGKLKHNLKINVGALLPGSLPPKQIEGVVKDIITVDEPDHVEVLQNVTKDRVRVPLKRRPSTRRGRKEAMKNSNTDFKLEPEVGSSYFPKSEVLLTNKLEEVTKNHQKMSVDIFDDDDDDDDDLFTSRKAGSLTKTKKALFDDDESEDDDIFKDFKTVTVKKVVSKSATETKISKVTKRKLENTKPEEDPLSALQE